MNASPPPGSAGSPGADPDRVPIGELELLRWSEALAGIARTGLGFTENLYERERFEEVLAVAADIRAAAGRCHDPATQITEWLGAVGRGVPGYVTPKVAVGAVVSDDDGRVLLIRRADSGFWLYPTGWADVGYSSSEIAVKEVAEETGIDCEPLRLIAVLDSMRHGFTSVPTYSLGVPLPGARGHAAGASGGVHRRGLLHRGRSALPAGRAGYLGAARVRFGARRGQRRPVRHAPGPALAERRLRLAERRLRSFEQIYQVFSYVLTLVAVADLVSTTVPPR